MLGQVSAKGAGAFSDPWIYVDEITHRTMNDYAAMLASVEYAAMKVGDASVRGVLHNVAQRLSAQAASHRLLRPPRALGAERLDVELAKLCAALSNSLMAERGIELTLVCDPMLIDGRRSWQLRLIVSELLMNTVRHAFSEHSGGAVTVEVRSDGERLHCIVSDNGCAGAVPSAGGGARIVDALVEELGGRVSRQFTPAGSIVCVSVPANELRT